MPRHNSRWLDLSIIEQIYPSSSNWIQAKAVSNRFPFRRNGVSADEIPGSSWKAVRQKGFCDNPETTNFVSLSKFTICWVFNSPFGSVYISSVGISKGVLCSNPKGLKTASKHALLLSDNKIWSVISAAVSKSEFVSAMDWSWATAIQLPGKISWNWFFSKISHNWFVFSTEAALPAWTAWTVSSSSRLWSATSLFRLFFLICCLLVSVPRCSSR